MTDKKIWILIAFFDEMDAGEATLGKFKSEEKRHIQGAVAVQKDDQGRVLYKDVGITPAKGAVGGLALGALVGVLTGGLALVLGALGGLIGGIIGQRQRDSRISAEQVNQLVAALKPSSSALLVVVDDTKVQVVHDQIGEFSSDIMMVDIPDEVLTELEHHSGEIHASLEDELKKSEEC